MRHLFTPSKFIVSLLILHGALVAGIHIICNGSGTWLDTAPDHWDAPPIYTKWICPLVQNVLPISGFTQIHQQQQLWFVNVALDKGKPV